MADAPTDPEDPLLVTVDSNGFVSIMFALKVGVVVHAISISVFFLLLLLLLYPP